MQKCGKLVVKVRKLENIIPEPQAPEDVIRATELVFTATMEGAPETRATYDGTYNCASWEVGDQISINGCQYQANNAGTSTTFSAPSEEIRPAFVSSTNTGSYQNQPAENLVDDDGVDTRWIADKSQRVAGAWNIVVSTGQPVYLKSIKLWNYDNESYPTRRWKTMRLYGSTTTQDDEWEEISDPAPLTSSHPFADLNLAKNNRGLAGEIAVNSTKAYTFYRIDVLDNEGDTYMQMSDMKFVVSESKPLEPPYTAYFPADLYQQEHLVLPSRITETWADGKFNMPMYAHSETTSLSFKNLCGVLKITVTNAQLTSVKSITVSSTNCATSGAFTVSGDAAVLADALKTANTVTVTYTDAVVTDAGKVFYVAIPAQKYKNLSIAVSDGTTTKVKTTKADQDITVARNTVYPIAFDGSLTTTGTAARTGGNVNWVQLWAGGPKFAEYNVGATSATEYGGYYTWGGTDENGDGITWSDDHNTTNDGSGNLSSTDDTATNLWGTNWRMPTQTELEELLINCDVEAVYDPSDDIIILGKKFTGKGAYASNSVFLPAAGSCDGGFVSGQGDRGGYWSSTPLGSDRAYYLGFDSGSPYVYGSYRDCGYSVRAVLAE